MRFVGREPEQHALDALLANARRGHGGMGVVQGEAGIGKTALLRWLQDAAAGFRVVSIVCFEEASPVALGAIATLITRLRDAIGHARQATSPTARGNDLRPPGAG